jgi:hypothetical protein
MKKYILYSAIFSFLFTGCTNEIPFDIQENPPKLILNALLEAEKEENEIVLALTGKEEITYISTGTVRIYRNGELVDQIIGNAGSAPGSYKTRFRFSPKDIIRIEAETENGNHRAWAEVTVPEPIAIEKIDTSSYFNSQSGYLQIKTTFSENHHEPRYYRIVIENYTTLTGLDYYGREKTETVKSIPYLIIREDVVLTDGRPSTSQDDHAWLEVPQNRYGVFNNSLIDGTYTMTTGVVPFFYWEGFNEVYKASVDFKVRLLSISKMEYFYLKALNIYDSYNYDEVLQPPVQFPSNVEGGIGIVGVSTESNQTFHAYDYIYDLYE